MVVERETGSHDTANDSHTLASANRLSVDVNVRSSIRHSMDEYYHQATTPIDPLEPPPSYDDFLDSPALRRRFNIQPREDEGREILPPYSSAISLQNVFMKKMELEGAVHTAQDRNWYKVLVTLQGTALTFHKCKGSGLFGSALIGKKHTADLPAGCTRGIFLRSYNLQHADVGIAADYLKKRYVIRVRAETDQFLLSCHKIETFVLWLQSLFVAIDLAPPLDDREIPQDLSIPRRTRRRNRTTHTNTSSQRNNAGSQRNDQLIREQEEIMRTQFPNLAVAESVVTEEEGDGEDGQEDDEERESIAQEQGEGSSSGSPTPRPTRSSTSFSSPSLSSIHGSASVSPPSIFASTQSTPHSNSLLLRTRHAFSSSSSSTPPPNPSISPDGKWRPQHQWTHFYDMMYAKRCMAILTHRSPRKSNLVIVKGKQWIVDWATGKMARVSPPEYGEVTGAAGAEVANKTGAMVSVRATGVRDGEGIGGFEMR